MKDKALVLDLDDTLYAEIDFLYSAYKHIAQRLAPTDWQPLFEHLTYLYHEGQNAFQYLVERYEVELATLLDWYRSHKPDIALFPNVREMLNYFHKDYKFAVITDGRSVTQRNRAAIGSYRDFRRNRQRKARERKLSSGRKSAAM